MVAWILSIGWVTLQPSGTVAGVQGRSEGDAPTLTLLQVPSGPDGLVRIRITNPRAEEMLIDDKLPVDRRVGPLWVTVSQPEGHAETADQPFVGAEGTAELDVYLDDYQVGEGTYRVRVEVGPDRRPDELSLTSEPFTF